MLTGLPAIIASRHSLHPVLFISPICPSGKALVISGHIVTVLTLGVVLLIGLAM
jgi:hypothetical protein